jgi:hypothetical protein
MYITLPSNTYTANSIFPDNTLACYKTQLDSPIYLEKHEKYELALAEVTLNANIYNIYETHKAFTILRLKSDIIKSGKLLSKKKIKTTTHESKEYYAETVYFKADYYVDFAAVIVMLNDQLSASSLCYDLAFQVLKQSDGHTEFILNSTLTNTTPEDIKLVFVKAAKWYETISEINNVFTFSCNSNKLFRSPGTAYMLCNLIEYQKVGNTQARLLRLLNFDTEKRDNTITFTSRHYLALRNIQLLM